MHITGAMLVPLIIIAFQIGEDGRLLWGWAIGLVALVGIYLVISLVPMSQQVRRRQRHSEGRTPLLPQGLGDRAW